MPRLIFGQKLNSQTKQMAFNVYTYFRKKKLDPNSIEYQQLIINLQDDSDDDDNSESEESSSSDIDMDISD